MSVARPIDEGRQEDDIGLAQPGTSEKGAPRSEGSNDSNDDYSFIPSHLFTRWKRFPTL
jgi:hypothetical protein